MSDSRGEILKNIRANRPPAVARPSLDESWVRYDDPLGKFCEVLESVGGHPERLPDPQAATEWLSVQPGYADSSMRVSLVEGVGDSTFSLAQLDTPHELAPLDWAVLPAAFAVAENGALWVTDNTARHRAVYFLCEHLVLVVPAHEIVHNMHEAYQRIAGYADGDHPPFGSFVAGPSKTADIEQSLVIGAQGPRSLRVLLMESN